MNHVESFQLGRQQFSIGSSARCGLLIIDMQTVYTYTVLHNSLESIKIEFPQILTVALPPKQRSSVQKCDLIYHDYLTIHSYILAISIFFNYRTCFKIVHKHTFKSLTHYITCMHTFLKLFQVFPVCYNYTVSLVVLICIQKHT